MLLAAWRGLAGLQLEVSPQRPQLAVVDAEILSLLARDGRMRRRLADPALPEPAVRVGHGGLFLRPQAQDAPEADRSRGSRGSRGSRWTTSTTSTASTTIAGCVR